MNKKTIISIILILIVAVAVVTSIVVINNKNKDTNIDNKNTNIVDGEELPNIKDDLERNANGENQLLGE